VTRRKGRKEAAEWRRRFMGGWVLGVVGGDRCGVI